ncbi:MAG TPA: transglycosylase SLT domain-containing protein [Terriglobia bacterium]|nr:transglycosylase SLT domain-containing protein [Terriglobia bacterium]
MKGLAYFALGYRELQAGEYPAALEHLGRAASSGFSLADFAAYYRAEAARQADEPEIAVQCLSGFRQRFPRSTLLPEATRALARSQLAAGAFEQALQVLTGSPEFRTQPWYQFLLGQAQQRSGNLQQAARAFEEVCYRSPNSTDAGPAGTALTGLQTGLGASFPAPSEELREARARALETGERFQEALDAYEVLMRERPASASAPEWRLGRDRCLYGLGRTGDALADLSASGWPSGDVDARRGLLIVRCQERLNNAGGMEEELDRLAGVDSRSPAYASALDSAAYYFIAHEDWVRASQFSARLADAFPDSELAAKAQWQVAWTAYLTGESGEAQQRLLSYIRDHPASSRVAPALYWLGRLAEGAARTAEARALYALLRTRFRNDYYSARAGDRLKALDAAAGGVGVRQGAESPRDSADAASQRKALPPELAAAVAVAPPAGDTAKLCPAREPAPDERPALTLAALGLDDLAARYLRARIAAANDPADSTKADGLRLTLARLARDREEYDQAVYYARKTLPDYTEYDFPELPGDFWSLLYPEAFWTLVRRYAALNRLDPYLVMAVIRQESGFNPKATSGARAHGLMQLLAPTARGVARETARPRRRARVNLNEPAANLRTGCRYLSEMVREFGGNLEEALAAYNAGPIRVRQWLAARAFPEPAAFVESIPFADTRAYVEAVLRDEDVYRRLMTGGLRFKACPQAPPSPSRPR